MSRIITKQEFVPTRDNHIDWYAFYDGDKDKHHYGWGRTKDEAVADLLRLDKERAEADEEQDEEQDI